MERQKQHANLNHIYHYLDPGPEHYNVETLSQAIYRETQSVADVEMFFRVLIFDALVGNHDRHGRNLAFIETAKGKRLSPIYDNPSALGIESGPMLQASFAPKGKIWTATSQEPEMTHYLIEMRRLDVGHLADKFLKETAVKTMVKYIAESHTISDAMKSALKELILQRYQELETYVRAK